MNSGISNGSIRPLRRLLSLASPPLRSPGINLPVGAIAITFAWFTLKIPHVNKGSWKETLARIDYGGVILCVAGVVLFLFGLTSGISSSWTSARVIAPMIVGVFVFAGFIFWEAKFAKEPSLPMHLFKLPNIGMVYASFLFSGWNLQASAYFLVGRERSERVADRG